MNPYAPTRTRHVDERGDDLALVVRRLRQLGATTDEVDQVVATWDMFDETWTPELRAEMVRCSDEDLRASIVAVREEHRVGTMSEAAHRAMAAQNSEARADRWGEP